MATAGPPGPSSSRTDQTRLRDQDVPAAAALEVVEIHAAGDTGHRSTAVVLPERPAVAAPVVRRDIRLRDEPVGDPQQSVPAIRELRGVAGGGPPEVRARVDHGFHPDARLD